MYDRGTKREGAQVRRIGGGGWRWLFAASPYAAVLLGMYACRSALATIFAYHAAMGAALALARRFDVRRAVRGWSLPLGAALCLPALSSGAALVLLWPLVRTGESHLGPTLAGLGLEGGWLVFFAVYYTAVNPFLEELFWRGLLGASGSRSLVADALFAGYHALVLALFVSWPFAVLCAAVVLAAGAVWRRVAVAKGGLLVPIASHLAADGSVAAAILILVHRA